MEFSEYLQLDRMAHWPRFLRHPVYVAIYAVTRKILDRSAPVFVGTLGTLANMSLRLGSVALLGVRLCSSLKKTRSLAAGDSSSSSSSTIRSCLYLSATYKRRPSTSCIQSSYQGIRPVRLEGETFSRALKTNMDYKQRYILL